MRQAGSPQWSWRNGAWRSSRWGRKEAEVNHAFAYLLIYQISWLIICWLLTTSQQTGDHMPKQYKNSGLKTLIKVGSQKHSTIGGLNDNDINDKHPDFPKSIKPFIPPQFPSNLKWDDSHCNEVSSWILWIFSHLSFSQLVAIAIPQGNSELVHASHYILLYSHLKLLGMFRCTFLAWLLRQPGNCPNQSAKRQHLLLLSKLRLNLTVLPRWKSSWRTSIGLAASCQLLLRHSTHCPVPLCTLKCNLLSSFRQSKLFLILPSWQSLLCSSLMTSLSWRYIPHWCVYCYS